MPFLTVRPTASKHSGSEERVAKRMAKFRQDELDVNDIRNSNGRTAIDGDQVRPEKKYWRRRTGVKGEMPFSGVRWRMKKG